MAPLLASSLHISPRKRQLLSSQMVEPGLATTGSNSILSTPNPELDSDNTYRIWFSNVVAKKTKTYFMVKRKWHVKGIRRLIMVITVHVLAMFGPFTFSWGAFYAALILSLLIGNLGVTLSFHRNLTHKSFTLPKWLEYLFAYLGSLALQGDPIGWVRTHRYHHKYVDSERDPHSPLEGFWYSHMYWIFDYTALADKRGGSSIVQDLETQNFYMFMRSTYTLHQLALGLLLYAFGGFSYVVWGMGVRTMIVFHVTFCVNSVCHVWGTQAWDTGDLSKNNLWVALVTAGEGWHNNHHAFEYSARHGLEWWQIDATWYLIKVLESVGLAKDVKLPTLAHKQRSALKTKGGRD